jgi:hypothetical protein
LRRFLLKRGVEDGQQGQKGLAHYVLVANTPLRASQQAAQYSCYLRAGRVMQSSVR